MSREVERRVEVLRGPAEWTAIGPAWEALRQRQEQPDLEHHPAWLGVETSGGDAGREGRVGVMFQGAELIGVAPFLIHPWVWSCQIAWRTVARFHLRLADLMGRGLLAPPDRSVQEALLLSLEGNAEPYDVIFLEGLPVGSPLWGVVTTSPAVRSRFRTWMPTGITRRHRLRLAGSFESYLEQFTGKRRKALRYVKRRLDKACGGEATVERVSRPEDLPRFFGMMEKVSTRTWQARRLGHVFSSSSSLATRLAQCAQRGWLRSYVLRDRDEPIAFAVGLQSDGVFRYETVGFDPGWAEFSPGNALLLRIVEDLMDFQPPQLLDFGHGEAEYKEQFGNDEHLEANVYLVRRGHPATRALFVAAACAAANRFGKGLLRAIDLVGPMRRRLRAGEPIRRKDREQGENH